MLKKLLICAVLLATFDAHAVTNKLKHPQAAGESGGGGNTLPPMPIESMRVRKAVVSAKKDLIPIIKYELQRYAENEEPSALDKKLYGGKPNLYDALINTDLVIRYHRSCKTKKGELVEASVSDPETPNAICFSAYRVQKKLISERADTEIEALIAHELSHKLGTTEAEAVEVQKFFARTLGDRYDEVTSASYFKHIKLAAEDFSNVVYKLILKGEKMTSAEYAATVQNLVAEDSKFFQAQMVGGRSLLDAPEFAFYAVEWLRLHAVNDYFLAKNDSYWNDSLTKAFGNKKSLTYREYAAANPDEVLTKNMRYGNEIIQRVENDDQAKAILQNVAHFLSAFATVPNSLEWGTTPNPMPLPDNQASPFEKFVGTYAVKSYTCADGRHNDDTTKFVINKYPQDGSVDMVRHFPSGYSSMNGLYNGAFNFFAGSAVTVDGGANWASRSVEMNNRWGTNLIHEYRKIDLKFEQTSQGGFTLTESWLTRRDEYLDKDYVLVDTTSKCTYTLEKQ